MIRPGVPFLTQAKLAGGRAASKRRHAMNARLVRVVGDGAGIYTVAEVAARLNVDTSTASAALRKARGPDGLTWAAVAAKCQRKAQP